MTLVEEEIKERDKKLLAICNRSWRNQPQFYNLTPRPGTSKFTPAISILDAKEYTDHWIVTLDAGIKGYPKFRIEKAELQSRSSMHRQSGES